MSHSINSVGILNKVTFDKCYFEIHLCYVYKSVKYSLEHVIRVIRRGRFRSQATTDNIPDETILICGPLPLSLSGHPILNTVVSWGPSIQVDVWGTRGAPRWRGWGFRQGVNNLFFRGWGPRPIVAAWWKTQPALFWFFDYTRKWGVSLPYWCRLLSHCRWVELRVRFWLW